MQGVDEGFPARQAWVRISVLSAYRVTLDYHLAFLASVSPSVKGAWRRPSPGLLVAEDTMEALIEGTGVQQELADPNAAAGVAK